MKKKLSLNSAVLIHTALYGIEKKLFSIFVPILLYQNTGSLRLALLYLLVNSIVRAASTFGFKKLFSKTPMLFLAINTALSIGFQVAFLFDITFSIYIILLLAVINGISSAFYWAPYNTIFAISSDGNKAKSVSFLSIASTIGKVIAPLLGSLLIAFNFSYINVIVAIVLKIAEFAILLCYTKQIKTKLADLPEPSATPNPNRKTLYLFYFLSGFYDFAMDQLLGLFLLINGVSISIIGVAYTILSLGVIVSNLFSMLIHGKKAWIYVASSACIILAALILLVTFYTTAWTAILLTVCVGVLNPICLNDMFAMFISGQDKSIGEQIAIREGMIISPKIIPNIIVLATECLPIAFIFASVACCAYIVPYAIIEKRKRTSNS